MLRWPTVAANQSGIARCKYMTSRRKYLANVVVVATSNWGLLVVFSGSKKLRIFVLQPETFSERDRIGLT